MKVTQLAIATLEDIRKHGGRDWTELYESGRKPTKEETEKLWQEYEKSAFARDLYACSKDDDGEAYELWTVLNRRCLVYRRVLSR